MRREVEDVNDKIAQANEKYDNLSKKINDGKGYIKEYNYDDVLLFEGEYLYGKRNGKGKEYFLMGN